MVITEREQEMAQKLAESEEKNSELERAKNNAQENLDRQRRELENKIEVLKKKQLTENEKKILQKLGELFKFFDGQLSDENITELEELTRECEELNFDNAPNLPENFKLESKGLINRANSFAKCHRELQAVKEKTARLRIENQQKEEENNQRVEELNQKIKNLNSQIEKDLTDSSEQESQIIELLNKISCLKDEGNRQISSLQEQLDNAQNRVVTERSKVERINQEKQTKEEELNRTIVNLSREIKNLNKDKSEFQTKKTDLERQVNQLKQDFRAQLHTREQELIQQINSLKLVSQNEKNGLRQEIETLKTAKLTGERELNKKITTLDQKLNQLTNISLEEKQELSQKVTQLGEELQRRDKKIELLRKEFANELEKYTGEAETVARVVQQVNTKVDYWSNKI
jgi:chromosome segregation ATPase